jgi:hypothetical protein
MRWAFGEDWRTMNIALSDNRWNERHADLFHIAGTDDVEDSMKRIGRAWVLREQT